MMDGFGGMGLGALILMLLMLLGVAAALALLLWTIWGGNASRRGADETAIGILQRRYAAGEINQTAYDQARRVLDGRQP